MSVKPFPARLGKYRIDSTIGKGAMGVVYKGYDENIARPVALKVLHSHLLDDDMGEEMMVRFRQEAQAAARCMHSNIVTVFDYGVSDGAHYIVMEYIKGIDLRSLRRDEQQCEFRQAANIIIQVLSALEYAHRNGVVHRDIKPANIMLLNNGQVKVADFGIARLDSSDLTQAGNMLGTPSYMSPEGYRGETADARSDLYSVGVVFYEMLTGKRLTLSTQIESAALTAELAETIPDQASVAKVQELLVRALQPDPASRYQSASEFSQQLAMIMLPDRQHVPDTKELAATVLQTARTPVAGALFPANLSSKSEAPALLSPTLIKQLEQALVTYVGPMASQLVKKQAGQCADINELLDTLANYIPSAAEQIQFRKSVTARELTQFGEHTHPGTNMSTAAETTPRIELSAHELEDITRILAQHLGPLASRIISRAQRNAVDWPDLCNKLADNIHSENEKQAFLLQVAKLDRH